MYRHSSFGHAKRTELARGFPVARFPQDFLHRVEAAATGPDAGGHVGLFSPTFAAHPHLRAKVEDDSKAGTV